MQQSDHNSSDCVILVSSRDKQLSKLMVNMATAIILHLISQHLCVIHADPREKAIKVHGIVVYIQPNLADAAQPYLAWA